MRKLFAWLDDYGIRGWAIGLMVCVLLLVASIYIIAIINLFPFNAIGVATCVVFSLLMLCSFIGAVICGFCIGDNL